MPYEIAIKSECPQVTDAIAKVYAQRIATLPSPLSFKLRGYLRQIGAGKKRRFFKVLFKPVLGLKIKAF